MSQLPITHYPINPNTTSGTFLAQILNDTEQALLSAQSGTSAPPVALAGTFWLDTSVGTNFALKVYTGSVWVQLFTFDPTTGIPSAGGQAVTSVNTRTGAVRIREIYDSTETNIIAIGTTDGLDLVVNPDADPSANLLATTGRIAFDTAKNIFVGRNNAAWVPLGGGQYTQYPNEVIADLGSISNSNVAGLQFRPISGAADITIGNVPFAIPAPLWAGGTVIAVKNSGTFKITFVDSGATASGLQLTDPVELPPDGVIQFIYDTITNLWYPFGGAGGAGKFVTYPSEVLVDTGVIASLPNEGFQYRRVTSGAAISLAQTPFGTSVAWKDGIVINVINEGANNISFLDGNFLQYGFSNNGYPLILEPERVITFQYDAIAERWYLNNSSDIENPYWATADLNIDWSTGIVFYKAITANTTFTFSNQTNGQIVTIAVENTTAVGVTATFPTSLWGSGIVYTAVGANSTTVFTFIRINSVNYVSYIDNMK